MKTNRTSIHYMWGFSSSRKLSVRSSGDFILVPPDREKRRVVDFAELTWPVSGHGCFKMNGESFILHPGWVWYYPPGSCHDYTPLDEFHYCWVSIAGDNAGKLFDILGMKPGLNKAGPCPHQLFTLLGNEFTEQTVRHRINALSLAFRIISEVGISTEPQSAANHSMADARNMIDVNFSDPDLNVARLADDHHMHRGSFSRAFRRAFDMTVSNYIVDVRLKNALYMLSETDQPIGQIAESCGFRSANYFTKVFLLRLGMTPKEYRKKNIVSTPSGIKKIKREYEEV